MDGLLDRWINGWMDRYGWMNSIWMDGWVDIWMDQLMEQRIEGQKEKRVKEKEGRKIG